MPLQIPLRLQVFAVNELCVRLNVRVRLHVSVPVPMPVRVRVLFVINCVLVLVFRCSCSCSCLCLCLRSYIFIYMQAVCINTRGCNYVGGAHANAVCTLGTRSHELHIRTHTRAKQTHT